MCHAALGQPLNWPTAGGKVLLGPSQGSLTHSVSLHTFLPAPGALATNRPGPSYCVPPLALHWFFVFQWSGQGWSVAKAKGCAR